jgi:VWFA-related protein
MKCRRGPAVALTLALALPAPAARVNAMGPGAVEERAGATIIEIPVNVFGKDGRPVPGLEAKDFELYDDGKKQAISAVDVIDLSKAAAPAAAGPAGGPAEIPASARRLWLIVFDLSYTSMAGLLRARDGARDFVTRSMSANDLAAVGTLSVDTGWKLLVNFTRDRGQLAAAVDSLGLPGLSVRTGDPLGFAFTAPNVTGGPGSGLAAGATGKNDAEHAENQRDMQNLQRQSNDEQARGRVVKLMNALAGMGRVLDSVRGRKHVLFFSEGFETRLLAGRAPGGGPRESMLAQGSDTGALDAGTNQGAGEAAITGQIWKVDSDARFGSSSLREQFSSSLGLFSRSDAVLDAIDIGGLRAGGDAAGPGAGSGTDALSTMASETGGDFVRNTNSLGGDLKAVSERTGLVYLLVYQPKGLAKPGAFHKLTVNVKVQASRVLARAGYYEPRPYASLSPLERLLASGDLVTGGTRGGGVEGRLAVAAFASPAEAPQVPIVLELPGASLVAGDKGEKTGIEIYAYANDASGTLADFVVSEMALDLAKVRTTLETGGIKFYGTLYLPPGDYGVRVLVRNAATGRSGVFSANVRVPAMPGGAPTVLPPFFPEAAGRWVMVRANPRADAPARAADYPFAVGGEAFIPAVMPSVANGTEARVAVFTYNFGGGAKPAALSVHGEIVGADGAGRPVELGVVKESDSERGGGRKLLLSFQPSGLPAGRYALKVSVTDPASKAAGESVGAFEIR